MIDCYGDKSINNKKYEEDGEKKVDLDLVCKRDNEDVLQVWSTFVVPE